MKLSGEMCVYTPTLPKRPVTCFLSRSHMTSTMLLTIFTPIASAHRLGSASAPGFVAYSSARFYTNPGPPAANSRAPWPVLPVAPVRSIIQAPHGSCVALTQDGDVHFISEAGNTTRALIRLG